MVKAKKLTIKERNKKRNLTKEIIKKNQYQK